MQNPFKYVKKKEKRQKFKFILINLKLVRVEEEEEDDFHTFFILSKNVYLIFLINGK